MGGSRRAPPNSGSSGCPGSPVPFLGKCISYSVCNVGPSLCGCELGELGWGASGAGAGGGVDCIDFSSQTGGRARGLSPQPDSCLQSAGALGGRVGRPRAGRTRRRGSRCLGLASSPGQGHETPLACPTLSTSEVSAAQLGSAASPFPPAAASWGRRRSMSGRGSGPGERWPCWVSRLSALGAGSRLRSPGSPPDRARASGAWVGGGRLSFPSSRQRDE